MRKILFIIHITILSSIVSVITYTKLVPPSTLQDREIAHNYIPPSVPFTMVSSKKKYDIGDLNFVQAAQVANPSVVHIMTSGSSGSGGDFFKYDDFSASSEYKNSLNKVGTGSGVIVSEDGYIVTNNHVIEHSDEIQVILYNKASYMAKIVGTDPSTDLALLKINGQNFPAVYYSDSDSLRVGEWVLAVGNPFNLTSTVTAGIVSAKGRNINILRTEDAIEAFIQTDAAVNPGNSGGALVNVRGHLVGINTAIATLSGTYSGYSFAVPVNVVRKVVDDLKKHGVVQRAHLGAKVTNIDNLLVRQLKLKDRNGVYIAAIFEGSGAFDAALKKGDVITEINGHRVRSVAELNEKIARFRPGNTIAVTFLREGKEQFSDVVLKNISQNTGVVRLIEDEVKEWLGADFMEMSAAELKSLGLRYGIRVASLQKGLLKNYTTVRVGFIIEKVNNKPIYNLEDFYQQIKRTKNGDGVMLEGMYQADKSKKLYAFSIKK